MMLVVTAILQCLYCVFAVAAVLLGNIPATIFFCTLMICEEISGQHQQDRKEATP